ncbi:MAG: hypothetical protein P1U70_10580 [Saprospiraceae bacterium]|nr:hypothetical protein [Saprospiraceae bacterium]
MKYTLLKLLFAASILVFQVNMLTAQDGSAKATEKEEEGKKLRFNGLGRTLISQTGIDGNVLEADSSTIENLTDGEFMLDLAVNATPNKTSEVQAILRLRNEFGGFFGSGMSVEVRELWARGIIADAIKYRIGDMDVAMSPYTLFNTVEEGSVNEAAVFMPQREVFYYEQFYSDDNTRRLQGAKLDFGVDFTQGLEDIDFSGFIARVRGTDFFTTPTRFISGGQAKFSTVTLNDSLGLRANFGLNVAHTFDDLQSGEATSGIRNTVTTIDFDISILDKKDLGIHLVGETGRSNLEFKADSVSIFEEDDTFLDIGAKVVFKPQKLTLSASFVDVGPDFFSIGAQSKRIDYTANKSFYNRIGTERDVRMPSLFDITRDRALYTFQLSDRLMAYDPRYSNTMPYGTATPNRRGVRFGVDYGEQDDKIEANLSGAFMKEIRGQGTFELKDFTLLRAAANFNIHKFASWENKLRFTLGYQYESISRGGSEVEQADLSSNMIELGLEAELFPKFELLLGAKLLTAEGVDYVPRVDEFNDVKDFPSQFVADDTENLLGAGFKYEFKEGIYMTLQYQSFSSQLGTDDTNDYDLNQIFVLYNMKF